ncbi:MULTISPECIES: 1-acylglycerol-3-phosphate O-acyltransferase [Vibrio]|jgi:1-acyl-sn-glycerol-3-phosphate acyltransferase|uniref:1-acyl-sn-glycerol-3-phosphate acyltransferase n=1 Tax=Vibrio rotiferianus TaxID=190895 RepID=A0A510I8F3_9VIBR|nr:MULTISPECIES: 1-acylglycerol-3-phosphate O-acyltransferase [Vibrio]MDK9778959.1 1-acylglycerol-3-phosphate O-acyltransferase [Vibrio sp. D401a]MDK9800401.1 1-acylglycerol-3-phosphate O-acyltransferase [Vibrio sp. D406a]NOH68460.1 1-acylglycerol-3-phosphate O-acyltransferase [Vibrio rotiferianus]PIB15977.1 1-acyl-sn-glycerol-3-phosphate acyltransferase [Vibrio rotiferianus CAIM 577 = LMG 21460]TMX36452.1 1-acyl-sn-glycerol-3-phosphate acyltransferase [Vibrio rotiferianus]
MIALLRVFAVAIFAIVMFIGGCGYCLLSPRNPKHVFTFGRLFGKMSRVFGIKLELRIPEDAYSRGQHVYIANHQNNWDLFTVSSAVTPKVVTVGKKSLAWMPLFGQLYWLTGNILIDRANRSKAKGTIDQVVDSIKNSDVSIWMFPEGTRSRGRGLLPFKTGAFHAAIGAEVPIIPIVCSSTDHIKLNRWNNGHVIIEMLPPVSSEGYGKESVRELANSCREQMKEKLEALDEEVKQRNAA